MKKELEAFFPTGPHVTLFEVNNGVGSRGNERFADAMVLSVWPSRGLWMAGVEIKISRGDWIRELKDPRKSATIQKYCKHWWLATAPGIVHEGELPDAWGHLEYDPKCRRKNKLVVRKKAPDLVPEPWDLAFACSMMRNWMSVENQRRNELVSAAAREVREEYGDAAQRIDDLMVRCSRLELLNDRLKKDSEVLRKHRDEVDSKIQSLMQIGINVNDERVRHRIDAVLKMERQHTELVRWKRHLASMVDDLERIGGDPWESRDAERNAPDAKRRERAKPLKPRQPSNRLPIRMRHK